MRMSNKGKLIKQWGKQIDPEICAEDYLKYKDEETRSWAKENFEELDDLDRNTINLYRRHTTKCDFRSVDDVKADAERVLLSQKSTRANDPAWGWVEDMYSKSYKDLYQIVGSNKLAYAIKSLTDKQTEILYLLAVEKMTIGEIAEQKGTTRKSVLRLIDRAKLNIVEFLKDTSGISTLAQTAALLIIVALLIMYFL